MLACVTYRQARTTSREHAISCIRCHCGCLSAVCSPQRLCGSTHADLVGAVMCAATRHGPPCRAWTPAFRVFMTTPVMAKVTLAKSCL